jgi:hypothetical protein
MRKIFVLIGLLVLLAGTAAAQTGAAHPGYYPIEEMGIFAKGDLEVDVDVSGAMLQVAAGAMEEQEESIAELVANLDRVRVQVGAPSGVDAAAVADKMSGASAKLAGAGWNKIFSVEEGDEQVYLWALEQGGNIVGLTAFVNEGAKEVVVINVAGNIDPRTLGRMLSHLHDFDIEALMANVEQVQED